ncbi:growth hormone secretagogue receptor type 1-like protein [Dinothrombium tinctorium]|uniref:Growth hormone secretagogue receptor type 1-like protein n=1 Tax=Dinothrombium tinctorium TaxID=1965070 RepID=A0A3S3PU42_9ACAR|nr:growth hormone secretagogue receptor type 1-like protein [Dinothrombium tinctorium]
MNDDREDSRILTTIICLFVLILGLTGNVLVPYVVFYTKELRNSTNLFLINLSIADLLVLVVCMPTVLFELHSKPEVWVLGEVMCKVVPFVEMTVAHGSILTMIAISFERYYAICKPLKAGYKCTKFRALIIIVCVWTVSITTTTPVLIIAEQTEATYIDGTRVNVCLTQASATWQKVYFVTTTAAFFWSPLCILIVIYVIIAKRLCLDDNRTANLVHHHAECVQMRARRQVVFMLAAVIACFFICLLPFRLLTIWLIFSTYDQIKSIGMEAYYTLLYICRIMLYLNSAINPILYNVISSKFRDAFVSALRCKRPNRILMRQSTFTTTNSSVLMSSLKNSLHLVPSHQSTQSSAKPIVAALKNDNCVKNVCETESGECQQNLLFHNLSILSPEESYV